MYEAFAAGTFLVLKWAFIKSQERIFLEFSAFSAEFAVGSMMVLAVNVYHIADGFLFAFHSFVRWVRRLRLHFESLSEPKDGAAHKDLPLTPRGYTKEDSSPIASFGRQCFTPLNYLFFRLFFVLQGRIH